MADFDFEKKEGNMISFTIHVETINIGENNINLAELAERALAAAGQKGGDTKSIREAGLTADLLRPYIASGFLQEDLQPRTDMTHGEKAVLAHDIAERFKIRNFWSVFGQLWGVKNLRVYYTSYLSTEKADAFLKKLNGVDVNYIE